MSPDKPNTMEPEMITAPARNANDAATTLEIDLLDSVLANTTYENKPVAKPATISLEEIGVKLAEIPVPAKPTWVTQEQRDQIAALRQKAQKMGSTPAAFAATKCEPTKEAAEKYIADLKRVMSEYRAGLIKEEPKPVAKPAPVAAPAKPVAAPSRVYARAGLEMTTKQARYIDHLRRQLRKQGKGWATDLADKTIRTDRREASLYINEILAALRNNYREMAAGKPRTGGTICCCFVEGCGIGPFVSRDQ